MSETSEPKIEWSALVVNAIAHSVNFVIMPGGWFWMALRFAELVFPGILLASHQIFPSSATIHTSNFDWGVSSVGRATDS